MCRCRVDESRACHVAILMANCHAMIRFDKLTIKAQEALQSAQEIAQKLDHQEVDCEHLLSALIQQPDGLVRPLLERLGLSPEAILAKLDEELNRRPQVHGAEETYFGK